MTRSYRRFGLGLALALTVTTVPLFAKVVASAQRSTNFTGFSAAVLVPLTNGGATSQSFGGKGAHAITYSAECSNDGGPGNWVAIEILVDGVPISPVPNTSGAFCSGNHTAGFDGWTVASYTVRTPALALGPHIAQVRVRTIGGTGWLGDSSLVVTK